RHFLQLHRIQSGNGPPDPRPGPIRSVGWREGPVLRGRQWHGRCLAHDLRWSASWVLEGRDCQLPGRSLLVQDRKSGSIARPGAVGPLRGRYAQYLLSLSTFEAVDTPVVHDVSVIYQLNFGPIGIPRDPANESWVAVDTPVLKWSSSDHEGDRQVSFQIDLSREASFGTIAHSSGTVSSTTTEWQALSLEEGLWYWRVRLSDGMTWGPWTNSSFRVDLTAPSLFLATPKERDALNSGIVRVSWSVEDSLQAWTGSS